MLKPYSEIFTKLSGICLTTSFQGKGWDKGLIWFIAFAHFPGINAAAMAQFQATSMNSLMWHWEGCTESALVSQCSLLQLTTEASIHPVEAC